MENKQESDSLESKDFTQVISLAPEIKEYFASATKVLIGPLEEVVKQTMFTFLTGQHQMLIGTPGEGKSYLVRTILSGMKNIKMFRIQCTKDMLPSAIIGQEIPSKYINEGREEFNLQGGICDCDVAHLEEINDAPDFLQRSLLTIINERKFERKDHSVLKLPLRTVLMTTNYDKLTKEAQAFKDRIVFKADVTNVSKLTDFIRVFKGYISNNGDPQICEQIEFAKIKLFADAVKDSAFVAVPMSVQMILNLMVDDFIKAIDEKIAEEKDKDSNSYIVQQFTAKGKPVSTRTRCRALDVLKASALLHGRREVGYNDLKSLVYMFPTIGGDPWDEEIFSVILNEVLPQNEHEVERISKIANIAKAVAEIKEQRPKGPFTLAVREGQKLVQKTKTEVYDILQQLENGRQPINDLIKMVAADLKLLDKRSEIISLSWDKDWE